MTLGKFCYTTNKNKNNIMVKSLLLKSSQSSSLNLDFFIATRARKDPNLKLIRQCLEDGADVNGGSLVESRSLNGSPLWYASMYGNIDVVRLLLDYGANLEDKVVSDKTVLMVASMNGHHKIVDILLQNHHEYSNNSQSKSSRSKGDVSQKNTTKIIDEVENGTGLTALIYASMSGHTNVVEYLLRNGANINQYDIGGKTAFWWASRYGHTPIVEIFLEHNADGLHNNFANHWGNNPLVIASFYGHDKVVEKMLQKKGSASTLLQYFTNLPWSPLLIASERGHDRVVQLLLQYGDDDDVDSSYDLYGATSLMLASKRGELKVVQTLLRHGANLQHCDDMCQSAMSIARKRNQMEVYRLLRITQLEQKQTKGKQKYEQYE